MKSFRSPSFGIGHQVASLLLAVFLLTPLTAWADASDSSDVGSTSALPASAIALQDPALEARARRLSEEIRCVVCENEPISQSQADIALDMRRIVREQVAAGRTDAQIRTWFAQRYGDFVLLRPPVSPLTLVLWIAPFLLLALGAGLALRNRIPPGQTLPVAEEDDPSPR